MSTPERAANSFKIKPFRARGSAEKDLGDVVEIGVDGLGFGQRLLERDLDDPVAAQPDHEAELLVLDEVDGGDPVTGGQDAVEGRRRAAPLDVAEDGDPGIDRGAHFDL